MLERAVEHGYSAVVLTVDVPYPGTRVRELRNPVQYANQEAFGNFAGLVDTSTGDLMSLVSGIVSSSVTWDDLEWVRSVSGLPVVLKGVLNPEDATIAAERGVDGIVVSNHGARQLDQVPATIDALEPVVEAVDDRMEVFLDGGVRRGIDVLIALALGARGVFVGRPYLYALAVGGEAGVKRMLDLLNMELVNAMGLVGATSVGNIQRSHVM